MMKRSTDPRTVYTRNDVIHVLFAGKTFSPAKDAKTVIPVGAKVKVVQAEADATAGVVQVTQRGNGSKKSITETWNRSKVPSHPRG